MQNVPSEFGVQQSTGFLQMAEEADRSTCSICTAVEPHERRRSSTCNTFTYDFNQSLVAVGLFLKKV